MFDHNARQTLIALAAVVMAWSLAYLLAIALGGPLTPRETVSLADPQPRAADGPPCPGAGR